MPRKSRPRTPPDLVPGKKPKKGKCDYCHRGPLIDVLVTSDDPDMGMEKVRRPVLVARTTQDTRICVACFRVAHEAWYTYHMNHGILSMEAIR